MYVNPWHIENLTSKKGTNLDIIVDEDFSEVKHLEDGLGRVVGDGVAFQDVFDGAHFPCQSALPKCGVHAQHMRQMSFKVSLPSEKLYASCESHPVTRFTAAAAHVLLHPLGDGLHFSLLTVGATELEATHLERDQPVRHLDHVYQAVEVVGCEDEAISLKNVRKSDFQEHLFCEER